MGETQEPDQKKPKTDVQEGLLLGMGNPLLDISATVDTDFVKKYDLLSNNAILAEEKHLPIYKEMVEKYKVEYIAGGATQNTMRVAQWILGKPNVVSYFGCVGKDDFGKTLTEKALTAGVNVQYLVDETVPTGTCAVLITGKDRSLVANLGAANHFKEAHIHKEENKKIIENASFYYIAGFFLTVSPESILSVAKQAKEENKCFMMNLSAPFLCQFFKEPMMKAMPYVDVLFGNETEAAVFAKEHDLGTEDIKEIALKIADLEKENKTRSRIVVFTQGEHNTIVANDGKVQEFEVIPISPDDIIDTNGAGDAFVGGFLSQLVQGECIPRCVAIGHAAANYIIQQSGVTLHGKPAFI